MSVYFDSLIPVEISFNEKRNLDNIRKFLLTNYLDEWFYTNNWINVVNKANIWKSYWEFLNEKYLIKDWVIKVEDLKEVTHFVWDTITLYAPENRLFEAVIIISKLWNVDKAVFYWINQNIIEDSVRWFDPEVDVSTIDFNDLFDSDKKIKSVNTTKLLSKIKSL